jgi:hypothetical protein
MISRSPLFSSVPLKSPRCPSRGPWRMIKLYYEPSPSLCLCVAPARNLVGRVPLTPLFLDGNSTPTIPHKFSKSKDSGFPFGCANSAAVDRLSCSNVCDVNPWLYRACSPVVIALRFGTQGPGFEPDLPTKDAASPCEGA